MRRQQNKMTPEGFWDQDDNHRDQKFYVAFCLLESALGDYAIARDLHCHNKLNWASMAYYYSLVHALRLLCFIVTGDFPTQHNRLPELYTKNKANGGGGWLDSFVKEDPGSSISIDKKHLHHHLNEIAGYFDGNGQSTSSLSNKLQKWGEILDKARKCREDINYECLIIAHQYKHELVTGAFDKLENVLREACETILPEVVLLFKKFIDRDPRKRHWYAYLNWKDEKKGLYYFKDSLNSRMLGKDIVR